MSRKSYAEFFKREQGTEEWPALTVECKTSYDKGFDGSRDVRGALLATLPRGACIFDPTHRCWRIHPDQAERAVNIAKDFFAHVYWIEGATRHDLVTGQAFTQEALF